MGGLEAPEVVAGNVDEGDGGARGCGSRCVKSDDEAAEGEQLLDVGAGLGGD
jgi:hypothetical protein